MNGGIRPQQRFSRTHPCPVCGGYDSESLRGRGLRCYGFSSADGEVAYCTREEYAGHLTQRGSSGAYMHLLEKVCGCGIAHNSQILTAHVREPLSAGGARGELLGPLERYYVYRDEEGQPLHRTVRFCRPKAFRNQRWERNEWRWGLKDVRRVLYRLPELLSSPRDLTVYLCEGERDVERLVSLGLVATTNACGGHAWRHEFSKWLRGRDVVILQDNDKEGRMRSSCLRRELSGASRLRIAACKDAKEGYDVSDWLDDGHGMVELLAHAISVSVNRKALGKAI